MHLLENYITDRHQCVFINASLSNTLFTNAGVPQGSVLGPIMFLIYINDIADNLVSITRLFADDTSLSSSSRGPNEIEDTLTQDLSEINNWSQKWLVKFNPSKTEVLLISNSLIPPDIHINSDSKSNYTEEDIIRMLEFLVDNIFVVFAGKVFQQTIGIPMGTNCAPLLADIFLYSYEAEFIQSLLSTGRKRLASQFNFTYRYIDDVLSINNPDFENYLGQMYPPELEIKDTTESNTSASYLDLLLSIGRDGQLHTSLYDKRDDFNFHITNFPFLRSNIPSSPAYGIFISQLIRYARASSSYECFILRAVRLSNKLLWQGYVKERLRSSLRKFYGRYGDLIKQYEVPLSRMLHDILDDDHLQ